MLKKRGDTLIEVAISIGIFGLVIISTVLLMNSTTNISQQSIEETLSQSEINTQAEALRFVHDAYASEKNLAADSQRYVKLWKKLIGPDAVNKPADIPSYTDIKTCEDPINEIRDKKLKAFIINPRLLDAPSVSTSSDLSKIFINYTEANKNIFASPTVYPQLLYSQSNNDELVEDLSATDNTSLYRAEGIWIMAACGDHEENCDSTKSGTPPSFYDFYIRACWTRQGNDLPTTTSTSVRLYNPDVTVSSTQQSIFSVTYHGNNDEIIGAVSATVSLKDSHSFAVDQADPPQKYDGSIAMTFLGWSTNKSGAGTIYHKNKLNGANNIITVHSSNPHIDLYPVWGYKYTLSYYNTSGTSVIASKTQYSTAKSSVFTIDQGNPDFTGTVKPGNIMIFIAWSESQDGSTTLYHKDGKDGALKTITARVPDSMNLKLYPIWRQEVTFSNIGWTNFGSSKISQVGSTIKVSGFTCTSANGGKLFSVSADDTFELTASLNTSGFKTHPDGGVNISIGPLTASITLSGSQLRVGYIYTPMSYGATNRGGTSLSSTTVSNGTVSIKMTKYKNIYTLSVNNAAYSIQTVETGGGKYKVTKMDGSVLDQNLNVSDLATPKVIYQMYHSSHCCSSIFNAELSNIVMRTTEIYY